MTDIKKKGSQHYKTVKGIQPIDLYESAGMLQDFALACIIKYAFRNRKDLGKHLNISDMDKIIHYAEILKEKYGK